MFSEDKPPTPALAAQQTLRHISISNLAMFRRLTRANKLLAPETPGHKTADARILIDSCLTTLSKNNRTIAETLQLLNTNGKD